MAIDAVSYLLLRIHLNSTFCQLCVNFKIVLRYTQLFMLLLHVIYRLFVDQEHRFYYLVHTFVPRSMLFDQIRTTNVFLRGKVAPAINNSSYRQMTDTAQNSDIVVV